MNIYREEEGKKPLPPDKIAMWIMCELGIYTSSPLGPRSSVLHTLQKNQKKNRHSSTPDKTPWKKQATTHEFFPFFERGHKGQDEKREKKGKKIRNKTSTAPKPLSRVRNNLLYYSAPPIISSALTSLRTTSSSKPGVFSMTRPFSLARCSRQMKQKLVLMSASCCFG